MGKITRAEVVEAFRDADDAYEGQVARVAEHFIPLIRAHLRGGSAKLRLYLGCSVGAISLTRSLIADALAATTTKDSGVEFRDLYQHTTSRSWSVWIRCSPESDRALNPADLDKKHVARVKNYALSINHSKSPYSVTIDPSHHNLYCVANANSSSSARVSREKLRITQSIGV